MNSTHRFISYLLFSCFFSASLIGQTYQSFEGKLVYSVEVIHPETKKAKFVSLMTIYANDSLIRTETESANIISLSSVILRIAFINSSSLLVIFKISLIKS